jgi:hypothetical protein
MNCLTKEEIWERQMLEDISYTESAMLAMEEYANQDKWISVKDELPIERERVLIMTDYGAFDVCYLDNNNSWTNSMRPQHSNGSVTHWTPLPLPLPMPPKQ